ncbi:MAG: alpha/beta fold hydrolase [Gammaproteobacteria bacterium]
MGLLATEGDRRIYFEHHAGTGLPVLLLHGWGMSCRVWDTTLVSLRKAGHAVVSFDQRGCGSSDKDFAEVSIASSARDAVAVLDHLGIRRVVLNGWSLGGAIAVEAASLLGDRCAGVVLTAAASPRYTQASDFPMGNPPGSTAQTVALLREDRAGFLYNLTKAVCAIPQSAAVENWMWSIFMQSAPPADDALADLDTLEQRATLAALDVPVLSVVGGKDVVVPPEVCREAARIARHGRLAEFAESGHAPFVEEGPRYREVLLDFLSSIR